MTSRDITTAAAGVRGGEVGPTDPDFESTVLLINGDNATNGGQNNTFLDSSSNNHTITRNGNVTQGSFSPFSVDDGKWGNYFAQNNSWLIIPETSSEFTFGTGDFTIETWFYHTDDDGIQLIFEWRSTGGGSGAMPSLFTDGSGNLSYYRDSTIFSTAINQNQWHHVALVRDSGTLNMYLDGVPVGSTADTNSYIAPEDGNVKIGALNNAYDFSGYISNFRVVKGNAVYTSAFTPPTGPLTAISGTSLLTCQSNRFVDNSSNNHEITANGTPKVVPFSPFPQTTAYNASQNGGSGYFDGDGDKLTIPTDTSLQLGTGDFTVEFWLYFISRDGNGSGLINNYTSFNSGAFGLFAGHGNDNATKYQVAWSGSFPKLVSTSTVKYNEWSHFSLVRNSGTVTLYINGQSEGSFSGTETINGVGSTWGIGSAQDFTIYHTNGYIASARVVKGTALYTSAFTPPTAPVTDITNTSLLCNFTNASIVDATGSNVIETVDNAQVDTTTVKYGTGAMEFDGSGDYLEVKQDLDILSFGTGDFTIEFWMKSSLLTDGSTDPNFVDFRPESVNGFFPSIYYDASANSLTFYVDSNDRIDGGALLENTWCHIAVARSLGSTKMFVNGTQVGSTYSDNNNYSCGTNRPSIGAQGFNPDRDDRKLTGFIDDLRITKGIARYTTNFTPPEAALPVIGEE